MAERATAAERRETRLLGALALTLAALAAWQITGTDDAESPTVIAQAVRPPTVATAVAAGPADTSEIVERPLFAPGRRRVSPIASAVAAPTAAPAPPPPPLAKKYMLVGILVLDGTPQAMLREIAGAGPTHRLRPGSTIEGWTLAAIEPRRAARFERPDGRETLRLAHPTAGGRPMDDDEEDDE